MTSRILTEKTLLDIAKSYHAYGISVRRYLHEYPELSWQETKTIAFIKAEVEKISRNAYFSCQVEEKKGGLVVDVCISEEYEWILFRADIDALPIQEETQLNYSSKHAGVMHACGHDFHAAMLLGAFKGICEQSIPCSYNLRFVWQRAEENSSVVSGGQSLVEDGVLDNISRAYALHISSRSQIGLFQSRPGLVMANASSIEFKVRCSGGHVMHPERGSNAIDIMTDIHTHLRGFALRYLGAREQTSFVPSISTAGRASNIMPNEGKIAYTFRNFLSEEDRLQFVNALKERVLAIIQLYPDAYLADFMYYPAYPALVNCEKEYENTLSLLQGHKFKVEQSQLLFSGEDFSYYLSKIKGGYWSLGAKQGRSYDHHTSLFNPDETAIWMGIAFWLILATQSPITHKIE